MNTNRFFSVLLLCSAGLASGQVIPGRYIVELDEAPAVEVQRSVIRAAGATRSRDAAANPAVTARRNAIAAAQARYQAAIQSRGGRVRGRLDTVLNALVIEGDEVLAAQIRAMAGVRRVVPDRRVTLRLDRAVNLGGLTAAVERIGGLDKAGLGVGIAILDSGIDSTHPALTDETLPPLEGFPVTTAGNADFVSRKVIVARSYEELAGDEGYGTDASDRDGHGTQAACAAACVVTATTAGEISGFAPRAYLGNYKVIGDKGGAPESVVIKGIDDAVKDGFKILNLSLGNELTSDPSEDLQAKAVNAAAEVAVVVCAAGNEGPDNNSINSPGHADRAITVGSSSNDRSLDLQLNSEPLDPSALSGFSSRGPSRSAGLKPDMVAVGDNLLVATTTLKPDSNGYKVTQGTSFAAPSVAGAGATLMAARPGLTAAQYRSLLVNSSTLLKPNEGSPRPVRFQGAGRLNLAAALDLLTPVDPISLNFGRGPSTADISRELSVTNLGEDPVTLKITVESYDDRLTPGIDQEVPLTLEAGASAKVFLKFSGSDLSGEYQGAVVVANETNATVARIPYWYGVESQVPAGFSIFKAPDEPLSPGKEFTIYGRVVDSSGIDIPGAEFTVEATAGGGTVLSKEFDASVPGIFIVSLKAGDAGLNVFTFKAGEAVRQVEIPVE